MENKAKICEALLLALKQTRNLRDLVDLKYIPEQETVVGTFEGGYRKRVNVACDSGTALILDVTRELS